MESEKENFIVNASPADHDFNSKMEFRIISKNEKNNA